MIDGLEDLAPVNEFEEAGEGAEELSQLLEPETYSIDSVQLETRHPFPALVEDDAVTKVVPSPVAVVEENHETLRQTGINFPSAVYWQQNHGEDYVTVLQQFKTVGSQDTSFWDEFQNYVDEFREIGAKAADEGVLLDYKPQNFGFMNGELVYVDTGDSASVRTGYPSGEARREMAEDLLHGVKDAPATADTGGLKEVVEEFDPGTISRYSRGRK